MLAAVAVAKAFKSAVEVGSWAIIVASRLSRSSQVQLGNEPVLVQASWRMHAASKASTGDEPGRPPMPQKCPWISNGPLRNARTLPAAKSLMTAPAFSRVSIGVSSRFASGAAQPVATRATVTNPTMAIKLAIALRLRRASMP